MSEFAAIHAECTQKLQLEQENILKIKETVSHLDSLSGIIVEALDGLDKKLTDMETLLLPVREQTDQLKQKATNAEQTLRKLQAVQEHYATLSQTDQLIDKGPAASDLTSYLEAMSKLQSAAEFFGNVNPGSHQASTARTLYSNGREKLLQYLDKILVQYASHLPVQTLAECIDVNDISEIAKFPELMPDSGVARVAAIWAWFESNNPPVQNGQFPDYGDIVGRALARSLSQLMTKLNEYLARCVSESDLAPDLGSVSHRRSSLAIRERRTHSAYTTLPPQSAQQGGTLRPSATGTPAGPGATTRPPATPSSGIQTSFAAIFEDPARQSSMVASLCTACYVLMRAHSDLVSRILDCDKKSASSPISISIGVTLIDRITRALFDQVGDSAVSLVKACRRFAHQSTFTSVAMLVAMQQLDNVLLALEQPQDNPKIKQRLKILPLPERAQKRLSEALQEVKRGAAAALIALVSIASAEPLATHNDTPNSANRNNKENAAGEMPRDGTVHEMTAGIIRALEDLLPMSRLAGQALSQSGQQSGQISSRRPSSNNLLGNNNTSSPVSTHGTSGSGLTAATQWADYEERLRQSIAKGILRRADNYGDDAALRAVFILNNAHYVVKNLQRIDASHSHSGGINQVKSIGHVRNSSNGSGSLGWAADIDRLLREARIAYLSSWGHLGSLVALPPNVQPLSNKEKERQAIKDKFSTFNSELELLTNQHRRYTVVDSAQRTELLSAATHEVTVPYGKFLDRYANSNFTSNRGKYIKYSEEDIKRLVLGCLTGQFQSGK